MFVDDCQITANEDGISVEDGATLAADYCKISSNRRCGVLAENQGASICRQIREPYLEWRLVDAKLNSCQLAGNGGPATRAEGTSEIVVANFDAL